MPSILIQPHRSPPLRTILLSPVFALSLLAGCAASTPSAEHKVQPEANANTTAAAIIPRTVLFGNPDKRGGNLSHDGKWVSWIAPDDKGVMNVFVAPKNHPDQAKAVTHDASRGIRTY